jgi:hypothetical protein
MCRKGHVLVNMTSLIQEILVLYSFFWQIEGISVMDTLVNIATEYQCENNHVHIIVHKTFSPSSFQ